MKHPAGMTQKLQGTCVFMGQQLQTWKDTKGFLICHELPGLRQLNHLADSALTSNSYTAHSVTFETFQDIYLGLVHMAYSWLTPFRNPSGSPENINKFQ